VNFDAALDAAVVGNEAKLSKFVHKETDAGSGRSDHLGKGLLTDLGDDRFRFAFLVAQQEDSCCRQQPQSALNFKILCRRFALVRDLFVFDNLPLIQAAEASFLDRRNVDENIFSATTPAAE
jgi:hypothetical protein